MSANLLVFSFIIHGFFHPILRDSRTFDHKGAIKKSVDRERSQKIFFYRCLKLKMDNSRYNCTTNFFHSLRANLPLTVLIWGISRKDFSREVWSSRFPHSIISKFWDLENNWHIFLTSFLCLTSINFPITISTSNNTIYFLLMTFFHSRPNFLMTTKWKVTSSSEDFVCH